ncbi:MAG: cation transporter [Acidimicrobiales bacterium]
MARQEVAVDGMHCSSCGMLIDDALEDLPGVRSAATSFRKRRCVVDYDAEVTALADIVGTIERLGYRAAPKA